MFTFVVSVESLNIFTVKGGAGKQGQSFEAWDMDPNTGHTGIIEDFIKINKLTIGDVIKVTLEKIE